MRLFHSSLPLEANMKFKLRRREMQLAQLGEGEGENWPVEIYKRSARAQETGIIIVSKSMLLG